MEFPNGPQKCQWKTGGVDPHHHVPLKGGFSALSRWKNVGRQRPEICDSILDTIGGTPLVRLNRIPKSLGVKCTILVKCEYLNPGGSVKDRIALRMVEEAEAAGKAKPGMTLIEPTSGNTGIGIALVAAVKGYQCTIVMPQKMSAEKETVMRELGAKVVRTPTEVPFDHPEGCLAVAQRIHQTTPDSFILQQYSNPANPLAHYDGTGEEILRAVGGKLDMIVLGTGTGGTLTGVARRVKETCPTCKVRVVAHYDGTGEEILRAVGGKLDMIVLGTGTGGTLTGVARRVKETCPTCKVVGVDPIGSVMADCNKVYDEKKLSDNEFKWGPPNKSTKLEGIGGDFIPKTLDRELVDLWIKCSDADSFTMSRRLLREEGLFCGGSSGAAVWGACEAAKEVEETAVVVVLLPDSIRNYLSKYLNPAWRISNGF